MNSEDKLLNSLPKDMMEYIEAKLKWIEETEKAPPLLPNDLIFCNSCKRETNHVCKFHSCHNVLYSHGKKVGLLTDGCCLWMCAGCETVVLENYSSGEDFDFNEYEPEDIKEMEEYGISYPLDTDDMIRNFFPKRAKNILSPKKYTQLPERLINIYKEVIMAHNNETPLLCAVGIRALIEGICFDQEITGRTLEKKIEGLASVLPKNIVSNLHNLRFMGNEAAHELSSPPQDEIQLAIEICEDLLNYMYELDYKAGYLDKMRKQRDLPDQDFMDYDSKIKIWYQKHLRPSTK